MDDILQEIQKRQEKQMGIENGEVKQKSSFLAGINVEEVGRINQENIIRRKVSLHEVRKSLTEVVEQIYKQPEQIQYQEYMATERELPKEVLHQAKTFFIPDFESNRKMFGEHLKDFNLGLINGEGSPIYAGRYIYPVLGFNNEVLGLIGYDKFHTTKYFLSKTAGFGKNSMFYGMNLARWIYSQGYVIVVEGIVDCLYLWYLGLPAIGLNGNALTEFSTRFLRRFDYNVILMPDNDETGHRAIGFWKRQLPNASVLKVTDGKDFDDWRKNNDVRKFKEAVKALRQSAEMRLPKEMII